MEVQQLSPADPGGGSPLGAARAGGGGGSFWTNYACCADSYDELVDHDGAIRPHWHMFVNRVDDLGAEQLSASWHNARRIIAENGVTYNVYSDPAGMDRPWDLDSMPLLIDADEWARIEAGLAQRARLLEMVLADIYGPQRLMAEGLVPPELIFAHPGFLRPCHRVKVAGDRWLHLYAANIGRAPDGTVWVIGDRTQAPSGAGYALENRIVLSRALPEVYRDCQVHRLSLFFRDVRETLISLAPQNKENPRIVLLTPGPYNETYFEHAYLARYLGYMLVEPGDLTVRDSRVYLKTLGGLQQVDVILRRQDDDFCDPLELRQDSTLGVPGLVQAMSAGHVAIANALGSGIAESPALMGFLPRLARHLLGQDLLLPSVESYWCADPTACQHVLVNLKNFVIKPAFPNGGGEPIFGDALSEAQLHRLAERIRARPQNYVAHSKVQLSTAPVLHRGCLEPRHVVLRAHLVAHDDGYSAMPGGLVRCSNAPDSLVVSMQRGGGSKDAWVLSRGPVSTFSLLQPADQPVAITRAGGDLPSRVADNLFWLGRYVERGEALARLARGILVRLTDQSVDANVELTALLNIMQPNIVGGASNSNGKNELGSGDHAAAAAIPAAGRGTDEAAALSAEHQLAAALFDTARLNGLQTILRSVDRIAGIVRDRLSLDTWRIIKRFEHDLGPRKPTEAFDPNDVLFGLDRLIISLAAFGGLAMDSMTRGFAWRFLDMGRRIERALHTTTLLRGTLVDPPPREQPLLDAVLEIADNSLTYRRRYMTSLQAAPVIDLLLADETNPRSVAFQLVRLAEHVDSLPRTNDAARLSPEQRIVIHGLTSLRLTDVQAQSQLEGGRRAALGQFLATVAQDLQAVSDTVSQGYLSHATVTRQLAAMAVEV